MRELFRPQINQVLTEVYIVIVSMGQRTIVVVRPIYQSRPKAGICKVFKGLVAYLHIICNRTCKYLLKLLKLS